MKFQIRPRVSKKEILPGGYLRLVFSDEDFATECKPGQFLTVQTSKFGSPLLRRPFGIHDVIENKFTE